MNKIGKTTTVGLATLAIVLAMSAAGAKDKVKVGFIGPLTGGVSVNGIGGRNSADLAVKLRNADAKAKYEYEMVVLDDECKPNVAVQVATKMAADKDIIAGATHYCSATAIATVDTYHKFGFPVIVWGAVLPDITYRNKYAEVHRVQRHDDQPKRRQCRADLQARLQNGGGDPRYHRLRQRTQRVFQQSAGADRQSRRSSVRFGVTAEQQDFTAELTKMKSLNPGRHLFWRPDADRRAYPPANGQAGG